MIVRNEIPLLEYDDNSPEVIAPDHDWTAGRLPEKCLFAFLGEAVHRYAEMHDARVAETLITVSHDIKVYVLHEEMEEICLVQSPIGAAASSQVLDTLISCGCRKVIAVGSCGVLADLEENMFIVPDKALRAEGTSYHYLPASRYIELDEEPISVIKETFKKYNLSFVTCTTWSTDGFSVKQKIWSIIDWKKAVWWLKWNVPHLLRAQGNAELRLDSSCLQRTRWRMFMNMMRGILERNLMKRLFCLDSRY